MRGVGGHDTSAVFHCRQPQAYAEPKHCAPCTWVSSSPWRDTSTPMAAPNQHLLAKSFTLFPPRKSCKRGQPSPRRSTAAELLQKVSLWGQC